MWPNLSVKSPKLYLLITKLLLLQNPIKQRPKLQLMGTVNASLSGWLLSGKPFDLPFPSLPFLHLSSSSSFFLFSALLFPQYFCGSVNFYFRFCIRGQEPGSTTLWPRTCLCNTSASAEKDMTIMWVWLSASWPSQESWAHPGMSGLGILRHGELAGVIQDCVLCSAKARRCLVGAKQLSFVL